MGSTIVVAILAGLAGMLGWGFADFFAKKTIDQIGDVASLTWGHIFGTISLILVGVYLFVAQGHAFVLPSGLLTWLGLAFFGVLQAIVYLLVYRGFGKGQLALLNPIFASYSGVVALVSFIFLGEVLHMGAGISLIIIFLGILLLNLDMEAFRGGRINFLQVPGFKEVATAAVLAAFWTIGWDRFIVGQDWLSYAAVMYVFMSAALLIYVAVRKIPLRVVTPSLWKYVILIGLCETAAYVAISWGYATTPHVSIVALLSGAFSLPTIVLARAFLKEKTTHLQTIGSIVIVAGLILLYVL
jgi:drug/metabolite transporter (DMT)-like permease